MRTAATRSPTRSRGSRPTVGPRISALRFSAVAASTLSSTQWTPESGRLLLLRPNAWCPESSARSSTWRRRRSAAPDCSVGLVTQVRSPQVGLVIAQSPQGGHAAATWRPGRSDRRAQVVQAGCWNAGDGRTTSPSPARPLPGSASGAWGALWHFAHGRARNGRSWIRTTDLRLIRAAL